MKLEMFNKMNNSVNLWYLNETSVYDYDVSRHGIHRTCIIYLYVFPPPWICLRPMPAYIYSLVACPSILCIFIHNIYVCVYNTTYIYIYIYICLYMYISMLTYFAVS